LSVIDRVVLGLTIFIFTDDAPLGSNLTIVFKLNDAVRSQAADKFFSTRVSTWIPFSISSQWVHSRGE